MLRSKQKSDNSLSKSGSRKLNKVILDLDQTIISAEAEEEYDFKKYKSKAKLFKYHDMNSYYIVFERPGLQPFLDFLFANFDVSIWTAASKDYALFIIEKIIIAGRKDRHIDWIFFSYHCDISKRLKAGTKDLNILWDEYQLPGYNKDNTIIIDDYHEVHDTQPDNCVVAEPFEFKKKGSEHDDYFKRLKPELQKLTTGTTSRPAYTINKTLDLSPVSDSE
jgi:TFIIF-interacting CTD phosphatase-like protein